MAITYFCPACWSVISKEDKVCPICGYDLEEFHSLPYEQKLLMGLEHPITYMKLNVIYTIGKKNLCEALPRLRLMMEEEKNPLVVISIAKALAIMRCKEALNLLIELKNHKFSTVRSVAQALLEEKKRQGSIY